MGGEEEDGDEGSEREDVEMEDVICVVGLEVAAVSRWAAVAGGACSGVAGELCCKGRLMMFFIRWAEVVGRDGDGGTGAGVGSL